MNGACNVKLFLPSCPGEGSKGQISFNFNYKVNLKYLYQTLCVFSQINDTKHIRQDFYSVPWVMPQGWDLRALGQYRGSTNFFSNMVLRYIKSTGDDEQNRMQVKFSS